MGRVRQGCTQTDACPDVIIAISGRPASGKTTAARILAGAFEGSAASFGDHVRELARRKGLPTDRTTLQKVGQGEIDNNPVDFLRDFLSPLQNARRPLIIDGLRHLAVRDALRVLAAEWSEPVKFLHIDAEENERIKRMRARGATDAQISLQESHISEHDVTAGLREEADLRIDRAEATDALIKTVSLLLAI